MPFAVRRYVTRKLMFYEIGDDRLRRSPGYRDADCSEKLGEPRGADAICVRALQKIPQRAGSIRDAATRFGTRSGDRVWTLRELIARISSLFECPEPKSSYDLPDFSSLPRVGASCRRPLQDQRGGAAQNDTKKLHHSLCPQCHPHRGGNAGAIAVRRAGSPV